MPTRREGDPFKRMVETPDAVGSVGDVPVCPGCGLAAHITHGDICGECFQRREGWLGGGMVRCVAEDSVYHETAACPGLKAGTQWWMWRDESCCYADIAGELERCHRCYHHRTYGFDHYDGDEGFIGHV